MSLVRKITWKYLRFSSNSKSVMAMTLICILGIAIGVTTLIVTHSVANGFGKAYRKAILDFNAHVLLMTADNEIDDYEKLLSELNVYNISEEEIKEWQDLKPLFAGVEIVEYLWQKYNDYMFRVKYFRGDENFLTKIFEKIDPVNVAQILDEKGLIPVFIKEKLARMSVLSKKGIIAESPFIYREALLVHNEQIRGILIKGVNPSKFEKLSGIKIDREILDEKNTQENSVYLGSELVLELGVKEGDTIKIMMPGKYSSDEAGKFLDMNVGGIFNSGMYDFDSQFVLMDIVLAQKLFNMQGKITGLEIKLDDWSKSKRFAYDLENTLLFPYYATSWEDINKSLFQAVKLEKIMFIIIMGSLIIVAAFNIIGTIMLRILYKISDISILRALGINIHNLEKIFVCQGVVVGAIGLLLGLIVSILFIWSLQEYNWIRIPYDIYLLKTLPVCISWLACVLVSIFTLFICWLTAVIASRKILHLPIIKGLNRR